MIDQTEKQVATSLDGIRKDHRERYEWAAKITAPGTVLDVACGVGYGSYILAERGCKQVVGFDRDAEAIEFATRFYKHDNVQFFDANIYQVESTETADFITCFEILEHLVDPGLALRNLRGISDRLICSVPHENDFPYRGYRHHVRHYTADQLESLLAENGWTVYSWACQADTEAPVHETDKAFLSGRTILAVAKKNEAYTDPPTRHQLPEEILGGPVPESVAILAMGRSRQAFIDHTINKWGEKVADELWAINAMGGLVQWDRLFHMDDVKIQEARVENGYSKLQAMLDWMKKADKPIYSSRAYEDYPAIREYPIEWVVEQLGTAYMNSTVAHAIAFAIAIGVKRIHIFGADFSYPESHKREKGRGCVEFWLGVAAARGVVIDVPDLSTLLDADRPLNERVYGYDTQWLSMQNVAGTMKLVRVERLPEDVPTATEMEFRYSHDPRKEALATPKKE